MKDHQDLLNYWWSTEVHEIGEWARTATEMDEMKVDVSAEVAAYADRYRLVDPSVQWRRQREENLSDEALELVLDYMARYIEGR